MITREQIANNKTFYLLILAVSGFFLLKGTVYAFIGSFLPITVFLFNFLLLWIAFRRRNRTGLLAFRFVALSLLLWSGIRLLMAGLIHSTEEISESHVREQFDLWGISISVLAFAAGFYLYRKSRVEIVGSTREAEE